jgi:hypothetical protein
MRLSGRACPRVNVRDRLTVAALLIGTLAALPSHGQSSTSLPQAPDSLHPDPFAANAGGQGAPAAPEGSTFSIYVDQDSVLPWLGPWGGDQNYTMGAGFGFGGAWISRAHLDWPARKLDALTGLGKIHSRFRNEAGAGNYLESHSFNFAVTAFTPRHLETTVPIEDDRPYASLLGFTAGHATIDGAKRRVIRTELTLGFLGLRIADTVQTAIHRHRRANNQKKDPSALTPYDPQGWKYQISDGGEPTAKYTVSFLQVAQETRFHDVGLQAEASLGYYTNVAVGPIVRVGILRSDLWSLSTNPLTAYNQAACAPGEASCGGLPSRDRSSRKLEIYAWAAGRGRLVAYNALLEGALRHSDVTFEATRIEPLVRELETGVTAGLYDWVLTLALARRSAEYNVGVPRSHTWGGVYITKRWNPPLSTEHGS